MSDSESSLEPIEPCTAQELYLKDKATTCAPKTVQAHTYRLNQFIRWCDETGLGNLNELTGRDLQQYRVWRKDDGDLNQLTLNQQMSTLRVFLKWCASIEAVPPDLYDKVLVPRVRPENQRRDETLSAETAEAILDYCTKFEYASIEHAVFATLWETGMRLGAANSLDVDDVDLCGHTITIVHRPDQETVLKNGTNGERPIAITEELAMLLEDFNTHTRNDITDDSGRNPLFTTTHGRMHRSTLRGVVYRVTAPCFRDEPCPECTDTTDSKCAEAVSPHSIRRGSITYFLSNDVPVEIVGDRMDVSRDVLDKHYDKRSDEVKLEQRRGYLDNI